MVTPSSHKLEDWFDIKGTWRQDQEGLIEVTGDALLQWPLDQLPVKFSLVSGNFVAAYKGLKSLEGLPYYVGGDLTLDGNKITNLSQAPDRVGRDLWLTNIPNLQSLEGFPAHVGNTVHITWNPNLPMLRCLQASQVEIHKPQFVTTQIHDAMRTCEQILNDPEWIGKGKTHMLKCALALKDAQLIGNARW